MIYVTSDLHGLSLSKLKELLQKVNFSDNDWLYILGDVIDRQNDGGVEILKWLLEQSNVQLILGNHEAMLLSCDFVFNEITEESVKNFGKEQMELLNNYMLNGGDVTLKALKKLKDKSPDTVEYIIEYLKEAPLYETVTAGEKDFLLCHSGLDNFSPEKAPEDYTAEELLWAWPEIDDRYYDDIITVFGHTPTMSYDHKSKGKILKTDTWIDVDVGVPYGNNPCLLRLDDLKEFYS
ncbi:MAG: metallophosphoesterase [Clostridia bacterium]|nr:metallophosphoesterase [Clostridia bacterium]